MLIIKLSTIEYIISLILIVSIGIQLFYQLFFYIRVCFNKKNNSNNQLVPVSVIICAKNEEDNIKNFLEKILTQKYPNFEVIVVNDCSIDNTELYIKQLQMEYPNLRYTSIIEDKKFKHNKKLAVTIGIKAAKHKHYVFIDADCVPASDKWLMEMAQEFKDKKHIILGYGPYIPKKGFLDKIVRYDTFSIAVQYFAFAKAGIPYMGVGRNLAYSKEIYDQSSKFTKHYHITSGDDDLFIAETGTGKNTEIVLSQNSYTYSEQVADYKEWRSQKRRHLTTSKKYKFIHKFLLLLEPLSRLNMYFFSIVFYAFLFKVLFIPVSILLALRFILFLIIHKINLNRLNEKNLFLYSLLMDIVLPILIFGLHIQNRFFKRRFA